MSLRKSRPVNRRTQTVVEKTLFCNLLICDTWSLQQELLPPQYVPLGPSTSAPKKVKGHGTTMVPPPPPTPVFGGGMPMMQQPMMQAPQKPKPAKPKPAKPKPAEEDSSASSSSPSPKSNDEDTKFLLDWGGAGEKHKHKSKESN